LTDIKTIGLIAPLRRNEVVEINNKKLTDTELLDLYERRSETAIEETAKQYKSYCTAIAMNILRNNQDAEEVVNEVYLQVWNSLASGASGSLQRPEVFSSFLGRITRNLSINRYKAQNAQKRGGDGAALLLSELESCIPSAQNVEVEVESNDLTSIIKAYLDSIRPEDKAYFIFRYWHGNSVNEIAERFGVGVSKINTSLHRTRNKLKDYLEKRGISHEN
jgi:RNA polymerase sigma-70 factor (ECF subfamily)